MRASLLVLATIALCGSAASSITEQVATRPASPQTPPRDTAAIAKTGTAVINGRVLAADTSRPLRRARVTVTAPELGGQPRTANTDNDGRYEMRELPAGRYRVSVRRSGYLTLEYGQRRVLEQGVLLDVADGQTVKDVDFMLPRMGVIAGRITDELGDPIEGVTVVAMRLRYWDGRRQLVPTGGGVRQSDDTGQYRILGLTPGTYYVRATTRETWTITEGTTQRTMGYAPTFFPGTTTASQAARVTVGVGQEVNAVDLSLIPGRAVSISGTAFDSTGRPFSNVELRDELRGENFASFGSAGSSAVAANGSFIIRNVPPGEYKLTANTSRESEHPEVAILPVAVDSVDFADVTLLGSQGGSVTGRVVTDAGNVPAIPSLRVTLIVPRAGQQDPVIIGTFRSPGSGDVGSDGTFSIKGVFGQSRLRVTLPNEWMVKSISHDGRDITDQPIDLRSGETLSGVEVVVTNRVSTISGVISDAKDVPTSDGTVLVFPEDAARWAEESRLIRAVRPDRRGRYQIKGLPAGEYLAIALEYVENGLWNDPEFLESLRRSTKKISVSEAGEHDVPLKRVAPESLQ